MPKSRKKKATPPRRMNRMRAEAMVGLANKQLFTVVNGSGHPADPAHTIVPIIQQIDRTSYNFVGTAFFITTNGVFATAAHVADQLGRDNLPAAIVQFTGSGKFVERPIRKLYMHNGADVAVGVPQGMHRPQDNAPLTNAVLTLSLALPEPGDNVHTYAYPNTVMEPASDTEKAKAFFNPGYYAGQVIEVYPAGRDRILMPGPCFQTSVHLHGGSSGGPVFNRQGEVIGINSTSFDAATNISFAACVAQLLDLVVDDVEIPPAPATQISLRCLADLGHIAVSR
ncbi:peptidase S7, Flavivirus NS3 serine protease family protein [Burkholderia pseudomallei MSHR4462]|nr:peptidase S7, Flavivirus NS3 serine protease family protein [Burkholderia pseudomallei MSHR4462]